MRRVAIHDRTTARSADSDNDFPKGLAKPALRALAGAGYHRLEQLTHVSEAEILRLHGMGPKAISQLRLALAANGLSFAETPVPWALETRIEPE